MKILLINCVYRVGSTGKIVASIGDFLRKEGHIVYTCYGIGENNIDEYSTKVCTNVEHNINALLSRITGIPFGGLYMSNIRLKKIIKKFNPDVIHVHLPNASMVNVYSLMKHIAKTKIKTIFTLHAEVFHTAGCAHAFSCDKWKSGCHDCSVYKQNVYSYFFDRSKTSYKKMYDAINCFEKSKLTVTAVSPWLADRVKQSAIMKKYPVFYVPNGIDTSIFYRRDSIELIKKENYKKVILFVTPYFGLEETDIKGGRYLPQIASAIPEYKFLVVSSITSKNIGSLPNNIQLWGKAKKQEELAQLYSEADLTILLSARETYSMVSAESLCCGTPVVGFKAGGPETIALKEYSKFVDQGNLDDLIQQIRSVGLFDSNKLSSIAIKEYSQDIMAKLFLNLYL